MNNLEQTHQLAEKLRIAISNIKFDKLDSITCSFGVVIYDNDKTDEEIMKRADVLLYKAKHNGKNRVES